jgi:hypothetical protein
MYTQEQMPAIGHMTGLTTLSLPSLGAGLPFGTGVLQEFPIHGVALCRELMAGGAE